MITSRRSIFRRFMDDRPRWRLILAAVMDHFSSPAPISNPEHDFLGIERLAGRVGRACRKHRAQRGDKRSCFASGKFLCRAASLAAGFGECVPSPLSRSLAEAAALAPACRDKRFSRGNSSSARSARQRPDRDRSNGLFPGNRAPGCAIRPLCHDHGYGSGAGD